MKRLLSFLTICSMFLALASSVSAQGLKNAGTNLKSIGTKAGASTDTDLGTLIGTVIKTALSLVGIVFLGLMVYAGYLWMTARGESSQIEKAQDILKSSIIGLFILLSAYAITTLVTTKFGALK